MIITLLFFIAINKLQFLKQRKQQILKKNYSNKKSILFLLRKNRISYQKSNKKRKYQTKKFGGQVMIFMQILGFSLHQKYKK